MTIWTPYVALIADGQTRDTAELGHHFASAKRPSRSTILRPIQTQCLTGGIYCASVLKLLTVVATLNREQPHLPSILEKLGR
jgi:hypothetical protein